MAKEPSNVSISDLIKSYSFTKDNLEIARSISNKEGNVFALRYHPAIQDKAYVISDVGMLREILQKRQNEFEKPIKSNAYSDLRFLMGNGLITSEGELWLKQVRNIQPEFIKSKIKKLVPIFNKIEKKHVDRWRKRNYLDLNRAMKELSLEMMCNSLFGKDMLKYSDEIIESIDILRDGFKNRTENIIKTPLSIPTRETRQMYDAKEKLQYIARRIIINRKKNPDKYDDMLSKFMKMSDPITEEKMSDTQLQDEIISFIIAGYETTASALTWTFYLLARNEHYQKKASEEARNNTFEEYGKEVVNNLDFNKKIFKESIRLYPVVPFFFRKAKKDIVLKGYKLKEDVVIVISPYLVHRNRENWGSPNKFKPERFNKEYNEYKFISFSKGSHSCTGEHMARMEAITTLQNTLKDYKIEIKNKRKEVGLNSGVNVIPDRRIKFRVTERN